jgi:imidazole glycerol-phosphate synthase subunit HisF
MRIIARIDIKNNHVIKGINLEGLRKIGEPKQIIEKYFNDGVDEIIINDSVASLYGRNNLYDLIKVITQEVFIPITLGGGIRTLEDVQKALDSGADKVAINSGAFEDEKLIQNASKKFGSSTIVGYIEAKKINENNWEAYKFSGREKTGFKVQDWIKKLQNDGCGEILLTSVDNEGTEKGFDTDLINYLYDDVKCPIIFSGGCGSYEDIEEMKKKFPHEAIAIASVLHYKKVEIKKIK